MGCSPGQKAAVGCRLRWTVRRRRPENGGRAPRVSSARGAMSQQSPSPGKVVTVEMRRARPRQTPGLGPTVAEGRVPGKEREKPSPAGHRVKCQPCQAQRSRFAWGGVWRTVAAAAKGCGPRCTVRRWPQACRGSGKMCGRLGGGVLAAKQRDVLTPAAPDLASLGG